MVSGFFKDLMVLKIFRGVLWSLFSVGAGRRGIIYCFSTRLDGMLSCFVLDHKAVVFVFVVEEVLSSVAKSLGVVKDANAGFVVVQCDVPLLVGGRGL